MTREHEKVLKKQCLQTCVMVKLGGASGVVGETHVEASGMMLGWDKVRRARIDRVQAERMVNHTQESDMTKQLNHHHNRCRV